GRSLPFTAIDLYRLPLDEILDVRVRPVGEEAARCHERVEPGRRVAEGGACALDDLPEPLVSVLLEEGSALHRANRSADADRPEVAGHRLSEGCVREVDGDGAGVEAVGSAGLRQQLACSLLIEPIERGRTRNV